MNSLDQAVLNYIIEGSDQHKQLLAQQLESCASATKEYTGCGYVINFIIPEHLRNEDRRRIILSGVHVIVAELENGLGFALFVESGMLSFLECFTYGEDYLEPLTLLEITTINSKIEIEYGAVQ